MEKCGTIFTEEFYPKSWFKSVSILKIKLHGKYTTLANFISPLEQYSLYLVPVPPQWTAAASLVKFDFKLVSIKSHHQPQLGAIFGSWTFFPPIFSFFEVCWQPIPDLIDDWAGTGVWRWSMAAEVNEKNRDKVGNHFAVDRLSSFFLSFSGLWSYLLKNHVQQRWYISR